MIRDVVILAAGLGKRLSRDKRKPPKPLWPLGGRPLIGHVFNTFAAIGPFDFHVVVGYRENELAAALPDLVPKGSNLHIVHNPEWDRSNGLSVLAAQDQIDRPFFLSMSDHLYFPDLPTRLLGAATQPDHLYLGIDRRLDRIFDVEDATKVVMDGNNIVRLDKNLDNYNAVDTGVFICPPTLFCELEQVRLRFGDCSLTDGVRGLAKSGLAMGVDIGDCCWQDIDTPEMLENARILLSEEERAE